MLSHFSRVRLCVTIWTAACQAPLSMGFSRQEYWSALLFPSAGDLRDSGIQQGLLHCRQTSEPPGKLLLFNIMLLVSIHVRVGEGNGDPLQYSCLENPMGRGAWGCSPWGREESGMTEQLDFDFSLSCIGEGHGNPLQCSCLENPRDGGAWWAAVYGVAQSRTRLKRLSSSSSTAWHVGS